MATTQRTLTIYCKQCHGAIGVQVDDKWFCTGCGAEWIPSALKKTEIEHTSARRQNPDHPYKRPHHFTEWRPEPKLIERPRLDMRLDEETRRLLNCCIEKQNVLASDIVRDAIKEYANRRDIR